jgi:hypothetical protein
MFDLNKKSVRISLLISSLYVGLGTLSVLSLYSDTILGDLSIIGVFITLPVSFIGYGLMYITPDNKISVLLVQVVMFLIFWFILNKILSKKLS